MTTRVVLPQLELTMEGALLVRWLVKEGHSVSAGQPLLEVETQKAMSDVRAPAAGVVRQRSAKEGERVTVNALLCLLSTTADEPLEIVLAGEPCDAGAIAAASDSATPSAPAVEKTLAARAVPATRKLARDLGIELKLAAGTGPGGRITPEDVRKFAATRAPVADDWIEISAARLSLVDQMRRALAEIPQIAVCRRLRVDALCVREPGVTFTHRLLRAVAGALERHPALRTVTDGRRIRVRPVAVAVAMETETGLVAPVLRGEDLAALESIARRLEDFHSRSARRALRNDELSDGPFALSNLGMLGVDLFTPFVFHGQTAVLAVGRAVDDAGGEKMAWFNLAADHRVVDGAEAARFLSTLQTEIPR